MNPVRRALGWLRESDPLEDVPDAGAVARAADDPIDALFPGLTLGAPVTPQVAFGLPAFYRALRIKVGLIATLPLRAEVDGQTIENTPRILEQPDPAEDRQTTVARLAASLTLYGEAVAVPTGFDLAGPLGIKPVDPRLATLEPGRWYVNGQPYGLSDVLHLLPFALPGDTRGVGAVTLHRRRLAAQLRATDFQDSFYRDHGSPGTVIKVDRPLADVNELDRFAKWWDAELHGRRKALVLPGDVTATPWTLSNRDAQFIETMQFSLAECALMIGIPPYFVGGETASGTYTNAHFERRNLIDIHLRDELYAIERALTRLLPEGVKAKFDSTSFLRLDPQATVTTLAAQTWLTADEKRAVMGYPPLTDAQRAELGSTATPAPSPFPAE